MARAGPLFHDDREPALEMQPFDVFLNPDEMAAPLIHDARSEAVGDPGAAGG